MPRDETDSHRTGGGAISIIGLRKEFDGVTAVDGIDLEIEAGEFFTLLGPSGCGKTTTLRMLGGFEQPTDGQILLDGVDVAQSPPHKRPVNTVFQSYALFPTSTCRRTSRTACGGARTSTSGPARLASRRRWSWSGSQRVRPASPPPDVGRTAAARRPGRALVLEPSVLLLDEPLGALDAKLRHSLRAELASLQREVGITFVFVTHDQEEALEMSDRLAVMDRGRIVQLGTPQEVYQEPLTEFVADFLGVANLLDVECLPGSAATRTFGTATSPSRRRLRPATTRRHGGQ